MLPPVKHLSVRVSLLLGLLLLVAGFVLLRLEQRLPVTGRVCRESDLVLRAPTAALLGELRVRPGSRVAAGELLAVLEEDASLLRAAALRSEIARVEGDLGRLEAELAELRLGPATAEHVLAEMRGPFLGDALAVQREMAGTMDRLRELGAASEFDLARKRLEVIQAEQQLVEARRLAADARSRAEVAERRQQATIAGARLGLAALRQELAEVERVRARLRLCAPVAAEVAAVYVRHPGEAVGPGQPVLKLCDPAEPVRVRAVLSQFNADLVRPGQPVRMRSAVFESLLGEEILGHVAEVVLHGDSPDTGLDEPPRYELRIAIDASPYPLPDDSLVEAEVMVGQRSLAELLLHGLGFSRDRRRGAAAP